MRAKLAVAAAAAGLFGALIAPAGLASAETPSQVIDRLKGEGYTVNIDRVGSGPLDDCQVTGIRNPKQVKQWVPYTGPGRGNRGDRTVLIEVVTSQSISVSLNCSA
jgi:hypothetical protein